MRTDAGQDDETGRGLMLVAAISERWDWSPTPDTGGKTVWCIVRKLSGRGADGFHGPEFPFPFPPADPRLW